MLCHNDVFLSLQFSIEGSQQPCIPSHVYRALHMSCETRESMYFIDLLKSNLRAVIDIIELFLTQLHLITT